MIMFAKRSGVVTSLVTPFKQFTETHEPPVIDEPAFERIVRAQVRAGVDAVIVAGWVGEGPTLTRRERARLVAAARSVCRDRVAVLADAGSCDTAKCISFAADAASEGADGVVVVTPPYNKPNLAGFRRHVVSIAESTSLPILLESDPEHTRSPVTVHDMVGLLDIDGVTGIVSHTNNPVHAECHGEPRGATSFLTASEANCVSACALGSDGIVSAVANLVPNAMVKIELSCRTGHWERARKIHEALFPLMLVVSEEGVPALKHAMTTLYSSEASVRLPLVAISDRTAARVEEALSIARAMEVEIDAPRHLRFA